MQSKINTMNVLNSYLMNKEIERIVKDVILPDGIEAELTAEQELSLEVMREGEEDSDRGSDDYLDKGVLNESIMQRLEY